MDRLASLPVECALSYAGPRSPECLNFRCATIGRNQPQIEVVQASTMAKYETVSEAFDMSRLATQSIQVSDRASATTTESTHRFSTIPSMLFRGFGPGHTLARACSSFILGYPGLAIVDSRERVDVALYAEIGLHSSMSSPTFFPEQARLQIYLNRDPSDLSSPSFAFPTPRRMEFMISPNTWAVGDGRLSPRLPGIRALAVSQECPARPQIATCARAIPSQSR